MLINLGVKWYQFVRNDDVRRLTKQPKLTAIIQSHRLTLFGHIMRMDHNTDAKRILLASPPADWRRQLGRTRITWLSTVQQDLKQHHLTLPEAADLAQNRPMWRMMSTSELHARNDDEIINEYQSKNNHDLVPYVSRQAVTCTAYLNFGSGHMHRRSRPWPSDFGLMIIFYITVNFMYFQVARRCGRCLFGRWSVIGSPVH